MEVNRLQDFFVSSTCFDYLQPLYAVQMVSVLAFTVIGKLNIFVRNVFILCASCSPERLNWASVFPLWPKMCVVFT